MIKVSKYTELEQEKKILLNQLIDNEFGHIPIVLETEWAKPDWSIIYYKGSQIRTFYNIVLRTISIDSSVVKVAGINNVITPKEFRGQGYASKILKDVPKIIFQDLECELGLLLCADNLVPFYEKLGWYNIDCPVYFNQPTGEKLWKARTMLLSKNSKISPKRIDLRGLPW